MLLSTQRPLAGRQEKQMSCFTSGNVSFEAHVEKRGYVPGETFIVRAEIANSSSRDLKPKFKLERTTTYIVGTKTKTERGVIFKEVGPWVPSNHQWTVSKDLRIPPSILPTIWFCSILTVEYTLKGATQESNQPAIRYPGQRPTCSGIGYPGQQPTSSAIRYPGQQPTCPAIRYPGQQPTCPARCSSVFHRADPEATQPGAAQCFTEQIQSRSRADPEQIQRQPSQQFSWQQPSNPWSWSRFSVQPECSSVAHCCTFF
ncbi:hypothetical protein ACEWY4_027453 [Coilia grayii]|uniref:Arrestin C-terminal-like domain-containing protein n=1 Tax=Coilia grayii TaxID=363190 RepID=A0ABD1IPI6_9TELE